MSKPICLLFALVILTTILCNNSVCSQRRSWKASVCGCKIDPVKGLQCRHNLKRENRKIVGCICRHPEIYLNDVSEKQFVRICRSDLSNVSIPL